MRYIILHYSYMKYPESIETKSSLVIGRSWGNRGMGSYDLIRVMKTLETWGRWWLHSIVNALDATELYTLKCFFVCYLDFTSI